MAKSAMDEQQELASQQLADGNRLVTGPAELSTEALRAWLLERLATSLRCQPDEIDPRLPFAALGLDSLHAFNLTGELAHWLQQELPATLLWDFATVEQLVDHIHPSPIAVER